MLVLRNRLVGGRELDTTSFGEKGKGDDTHAHPAMGSASCFG